MYRYACTSVCTHVCIYTHKQTHTNKHTQTHTHTNTHTHCLVYAEPRRAGYAWSRLAMLVCDATPRRIPRARVRRHTVFDNLAQIAEHSADILVPPRDQIPTQYGFFRILVICAAKPRQTAAAAREHRRVLAPRLPTPGASVTSPLHTQ